MVIDLLGNCSTGYNCLYAELNSDFINSDLMNT
jgi:hypothetical protein